MSEKKRVRATSRSTAPIGQDVSATDDHEHAACVDAWLERSARGLAPEILLGLLEAALGALWARTTTTLGDVTLTAIAERVLYSASEKFPLLSSLEVAVPGGIQCRGLRAQIGSVRAAELLEGIRFVLVELLTVLGNLTAEILTSELHAELGAVALPEAAGVSNAAHGSPRNPRARAKRS